MSAGEVISAEYDSWLDTTTHYTCRIMKLSFFVSIQFSPRNNASIHLALIIGFVEKRGGLTRTATIITDYDDPVGGTLGRFLQRKC
jgi:hypothetical protein